MAIRRSDIDPGMVEAAFTEPDQQHHSLGAGFGIEHATGPETLRGVESAAELPVGTKIFITAGEKHLRGDEGHDALAIILGHSMAEVQGEQRQVVDIVSLRPKSGEWKTHNAYVGGHELTDAAAVLDRLFHPEEEFGSVAVFSRTTALGASEAGTVGEEGCASHETSNLGDTLRVSQLLDAYNWKPSQILPRSGRIRRMSHAGSKAIRALPPGAQLPNQPDTTKIDQLGMLNRIVRLDRDPTSEMQGVGPEAVLRGIEKVVEKDRFADLERPVGEIRTEINRTAQKVVA